MANNPSREFPADVAGPTVAASVRIVAVVAVVGVVSVAGLGSLAGCRSASPQAVVGGQGSVDAATPTAPRVVATTSLVGDTVTRVAGGRADLSVLLPLGADPHGFEARPRDVATLAGADLVFANGLGLEPFLGPLLEGTDPGPKLVELSDGIEPIVLADHSDAEEHHDDGDADDHHDHGGADPHAWFDPANVLIWVDRVEAELAAIDPDGAADYAANADAYRDDLRALDEWIERQVAEVPVERRKLVTDHRELGYFARRYGFEEVGALVESLSTLAQPSAGEIAALEERVRASGARAVFVGVSVSPALAERVAADTDIAVVRLHTGSLGEPGGPAGDYLSFMRSNVSAIVESLR
jgi:ABC-type Zn uptake system ZnuABC Zn-binding protein ZnuA